MGLVLAYNKGNAQPNFTAGAAITGTAEVGQTLTCTYTVVRAKTVTVRWYSYFDDAGTDQVLIGTGATYTLTGNEFGRYIRAIPTASNNLEWRGRKMQSGDSASLEVNLSGLRARSRFRSTSQQPTKQTCHRPSPSQLPRPSKSLRVA